MKFKRSIFNYYLEKDNGYVFKIIKFIVWFKEMLT